MTDASTRQRAEGVLAPTVARSDFRDAERICGRRKSRGDREAMLAGLKRLHHELGYLGAREITADERIPSDQSFANEFGGLMAAYALPRHRCSLRTMAPFRERAGELISEQLKHASDRPINVYRVWKQLQGEGLVAGYAVVWNYVQIWHGPGL